jgi:hypothetical protein
MTLLFLYLCFIEVEICFALRYIGLVDLHNNMVHVPRDLCIFKHAFLEVTLDGLRSIKLKSLNFFDLERRRYFSVFILAMLTTDWSAGALSFFILK